MENLYVNGTNCTPAIYFNIEKGILTISGNSYPENSVQCYEELEKALDYFIENHNDVSLFITCEFIYINTSSTKTIFSILKNLIDKLNNVSVVWGYEEEDEDIKELGEDFSDTLHIDFEYRIFSA